MKTVEQLAREVADKDKDDPVRHGLITLTFEEIERFRDAAIAQAEGKV